MIEPQVPQDRILIQPENQNVDGQNNQNVSIHEISDFRWPRIIGVIALIMLIVIVGWVIISDGGEILAGIAAHVTEWFDRSTIDPHDTKGFISFVRLSLTAAFIALILFLIRKK